MLLLILGRRYVLALLVIDVAAQFEVDITLCGGRRGSAVGGGKRLARGNCGVRSGLEGLQASRGIGNNSEVASEGRPNVGGSGLRVNLKGLIRIHGQSLIVWTHLVVDQAPLLKERVNTHDGTNIASQIATASSDG